MKLSSILTACSLALIGVGLYFAPNGVSDAVRGAVTDLLRPAQMVSIRAKEFVASRVFGTPAKVDADRQMEIERLTEELDIERTRYRALQVRFAQFEERYRPEHEISARLVKSQRLIGRSLIEVAVLGDSLAEQWRAGKILDQGSKNGLRENELVITSHKPQKTLVDYGEDADISSEDALLLGRCVIGKIEHVGRWTSTVQLVTDSHYRGRAQLIRETTDGRFVFESQGILKGQGVALCKLDGIPAEKSVRVNDAIYTADRDGLRPTPLYYGHVVEATLGADDREWTVFVKPVTLPSQLTTVHVLRTAVNPDRLAVK